MTTNETRVKAVHPVTKQPITVTAGQLHRSQCRLMCAIVDGATLGEAIDIVWRSPDVGISLTNLRTLQKMGLVNWGEDDGPTEQADELYTDMREKVEAQDAHEAEVLAEIKGADNG